MRIREAWLNGDPLVESWLGGPPRLDRIESAAFDRSGVPGLIPRGHVAVIAGQQPALGLGPLYSLVKAAQAVALARRLTVGGTPATALFWSASEDHDVGEAGHCDLIGRDGRLQRISDGLGGGKAALRHRPASHGWQPTTDALRGLGPGLGSAWWLDHTPRTGEGFGAWQCRLMSALLPGLVAVEAHALRPRWAAAIPQTLPAWPHEALAERRRSIIAAGFVPAFDGLDQPPWFHDTPTARTALSPDAVLALPRNELSPGAALRPVLQQLALPGAVFIAGPGELAYHAEIGPVYAALAAPRPLLWPRTSVTIVPGWVERGARAQGTTVERLLTGDLPATVPPPRHEQLRAAISGLSTEDPRLAASYDGARLRLLHALDRLDRSVARAQRPAGPSAGALATWLRPRGAPQDRTVSVAQTIWEHGPGIASVLVEALDAGEPVDERIIALG